MYKFTNRDGEIRLYDGTTTPYYLKIVFSGGDISFAAGIPQPEETLALDRQKVDASACYVRGSDAAIMEPVDVSFSAQVTDADAFGYLMDWLEGSTVNSHAMVTTKGSTQRVTGVANPAFADSAKKCVNVEFKLDGPSTDLVWKLAEVHVPLDQATVGEAEDGVTVQLRGRCYGTIARSDDFTSGTDVTA